MNNEIWSTLPMLDQILLLADEGDGVMWNGKMVVDAQGRLVPVDENFLSANTPPEDVCIRIPGTATACGLSVLQLTESGQTRITKILELPAIRENILRVLSVAKHSLYTLTQFIWAPFSEKHIKSVVDKLITEGIIMRLPIPAADFYAIVSK